MVAVAPGNVHRQSKVALDQAVTAGHGKVIGPATAGRKGAGIAQATHHIPQGLWCILG